MPWVTESKHCFNIRMKYKEPKHDYTTTDCELDLSEDDARIFGEQHSEGSVLFKGKWIDVLDIEEIEIRETDQKSTYYWPALTFLTIFQSQAYPNVTRRFIKSPPKKEVSGKQEKTKQSPSKDIFIVHGHDDKPKLELARMLEKLGFNAIVLSEQADKGRTIIEKLEQETTNIGYAFVILTPDDLAVPSTLPILSSLPPELPFKPRARQNVILE